MNKPIDISNVTLRTERLILRPWTLDDMDDMFEYARVEDVGIWAGWLPHKDREESKRIVESFIKHKKVLTREKYVGIKLVPVSSEYAEDLWAFRQEVIEKDAGDDNQFAGCNGLAQAKIPQEWIELCTKRQLNDWSKDDKMKVPSHSYLAVRTSDNKIVGMIDLRHHINHPILGTWGGHSGYTVRPSERGHGYAKEMLRQNLINARKMGITQFLITCHPWNVASEKTILANGGIFECLVDAGEGEMLKRYWIGL